MLKYRRLMYNGHWKGPWHAAPMCTVEGLIVWLHKNGYEVNLWERWKGRFPQGSVYRLQRGNREEFCQFAEVDDAAQPSAEEQARGEGSLFGEPGWKPKRNKEQAVFRRRMRLAEEVGY